MTNFEIISIEGNIGSGKSTLLAHLREYYKDCSNILFLKEPVDDWEKIVDENGETMLEKFYHDQEKYSFPFQMMAYISRLKLLRNAIQSIKNSSQKVFIFTERSLFTDRFVFAKMLYDSKKIEHVNYMVYLNWFDTFIEEFPVHKIIYVKASPSHCFERITKRSRHGEESISIDYLVNCDLYHEKMMEQYSEESTCKSQLILDGDLDIYNDENVMENWIEKIQLFSGAYILKKLSIPDGIWIIPNFISKEEELQLIDEVNVDDLSHWTHHSTFNGHCFSKSYGFSCKENMSDNISKYAIRLNDIVKDNKLLPNELRQYVPNEYNTNYYDKSQKHYLRPHFDDRASSGPVLMNLSLLGQAKMTYVNPKTQIMVSVDLPPRCLQLITGKARYDFTHEIKNEDLLSEKRISITWRNCIDKSKKTETKSFTIMDAFNCGKKKTI